MSRSRLKGLPIFPPSQRSASPHDENSRYSQIHFPLYSFNYKARVFKFPVYISFKINGYANGARFCGDVTLLIKLSEHFTLQLKRIGLSDLGDDLWFTPRINQAAIWTHRRDMFAAVIEDFSITF